MQQELLWSRCHNVHEGATGPAVGIFTDEDPSTTIKGCGFKDAETAQRTLWLTAQPGSRYKRYWTVRAMLERAERHPRYSCSRGMQEAAAVYRAWIGARKRGDEDLAILPASLAGYPSETALQCAEREQQTKLRQCSANSRSLRCLPKGSGEKELRKSGREAQSEAVKALRRAARPSSAGAATPASVSREWFTMSSSGFVAVFGAPGEHGYGYHECVLAAQSGLPRFRCTCPGQPLSRSHRVVICVDADRTLATADAAQPGRGAKYSRYIGSECLGLGKRFPFLCFVLEFDGSIDKARFCSCNKTTGAATRAGRQLSLLSFMNGMDPDDSVARGPPAKIRRQAT